MKRLAGRIALNSHHWRALKSPSVKKYQFTRVNTKTVA